MSLKNKIESLYDNQRHEIHNGHESQTIIEKSGDYFNVYSIPMFGGPEVLECSFHHSKIDDLIKTIESWT